LAAQIAPFAKSLRDNEEKIVAELSAVQGVPAKIDGYYHAKRETVKKVMRPSTTLNEILTSNQL
jgi:isocitrate dehydrogenase